MINNRIYELLGNPNLIKSEDKAFLEEKIKENPYFHPLRYLLLDAIEDKNGLEYKQALELASLYSPNRKYLFGFANRTIDLEMKITTKPTKSQTFEQKIEIEDVEAKAIENGELSESNLENFEESKPNEVYIEIQEKEIKSIEEIDVIKNAFEEKTNLINEKPVVEKQTEYSFYDWLNRGKSYGNNSHQENKAIFSKNKIKEIDNYIEGLQASRKKNNQEKKETENNPLVTETLAELYIKQKKYNKAIKTYEELMQKNPEKSSLFADSIKELKRKHHDGI